MIRDRDILLIGLLLGGVAGGLFYIAIWLSLPTEVRQALMLVVGMLLMAAMSTLSTYLAATATLRAVVIPASSAISVSSNQPPSTREKNFLIIENGSDLHIIMNEIHSQMRLLARDLELKDRIDHLSFTAIATNLRYHENIDEKLFRGLIFFINTYNDFRNSIHTDIGLLDVTTNIGKELLNQLRDLNTANESSRAQTRRSS